MTTQEIITELTRRLYAEAEYLREHDPKSEGRDDLDRLARGARGLVVAQDYSRAWRSVGAALDGGDYGIEEQDRTRGLYVVEFVDRAGENRKADENRGWFSGWFGGSKSAPQPRGTRYQVRLADQGAETFVLVQTASGAPDDSAGARTLLETIAKGVR